MHIYGAETVLLHDFLSERHDGDRAVIYGRDFLLDHGPFVDDPQGIEDNALTRDMAGEDIFGVHLPVFEPVIPLLPLEHLEKDRLDYDIGSPVKEGLFDFSLGDEDVVPSVRVLFLVFQRSPVVFFQQESALDEDFGSRIYLPPV